MLKFTLLKNTSLLYVTLVTLLLILPSTISAQAPNLGSVASFVLFSSNGAVTNSGSSNITGNVGTNNGSSTAFGNVNGIMHDNDGASALCSSDLLIAYNQLDAATPTFFPAQLLGNGQTLNAGVYAISGNAALNLELQLDGQNNANAVFIIQIDGALSANAGSKVTLINGALACNVFWKVEGLVSLATGSTMRGTVIANNAAITMGSGVELEGRALSTTGAVTLNGVLAYLPTGCGSPYLTGPLTPDLGSAACYALFSTNGSVSNTGTTIVTGDIGTNTGSVTGYSAANVTGTIHLIPDASTALASNDLLAAYNYIHTLPTDIELLYPAQFGNGLVLTPHTYLMNGAATFTDTVFLNAEGNSNAIFVIKINGAMNAATYSKVALINGAQATNVYWKVEGAVNLYAYSEFAGTIISNNGAISGLNTGTELDGRALTTNGALNTTAITADMGPACAIAGMDENSDLPSVVAYPNPFGDSFTLSLSETGNYSVSLLDGLGRTVYHSEFTQTNLISIEPQTTLPQGTYLLKIESASGMNFLNMIR